MEALAVRNLSFTYPGAAAPALGGVSFSLECGSFTVLAGPSGCGKSTLLRQIHPAAAPAGERSGEIRLFGRPLGAFSAREAATTVGFVRQDTDEQIVTDKVYHELAFGLESLGLPNEAIRARVAEMAGFFGMEPLFHCETSSLSGGQKQLLNLASVMVMGPDVLILDEPTSQLDPIAASDLLAAVGRIHRELGTTVLLTEHRLGDVLPLADRLLLLDDGRLVCDGAPREVGLQLRALGNRMFEAMPVPMQVACAAGCEENCPVTVREGRAWLAEFAERTPLLPVPPVPERNPGEIAAELRGAWFRYEKDAPDVLRGLNLTVRRGEILAVLGGNGAGKSTALGLLSGRLRPWRGSAEIRGRVAALPQDPRALFVKMTVRDDLKFALPEGKSDDELDRVIRFCSLGHVLSRHPYDLSGGEQQRAALAKLLLQDPEILLLDEPTKGLDARFKRELAALLRRLSDAGRAVVLVTHDLDFASVCADRCVLVFDGAVVSNLPPREFFSGSSFYTTSAARMARGIVPGAVTADDLIACCGAAPPAPPDEFDPPAAENTKKSTAARPKLFSNPLPKKTLLLMFLSLLLVPMTIAAGTTILGGRKCLVTSLLVLLECMAPFFLAFEGRRPQACEIVLLASLCALGVAGRAALAWLPQCKPVIALVVVAGAALGGEAGFLTGAVTMLTSNVLFGQGPWTPWQMFAMGLIGLAAGALSRAGLLRRSRAGLSVFGFLAAIFIFGGIMNPASALIAQRDLTWETLAAYYVSGFPMDLVQAASTAVFLWLLGVPMLEKLDRVKLKYGIA